MLRECINIQILKDSNRPYHNFYFLVLKENGKYYLINTAVFLNKISVKDANLSPSIDKFLEDFSRIAISSVVDLFSSYDQVLLVPKSRDMTAF